MIGLPMASLSLLPSRIVQAAEKSGNCSSSTPGVPLRAASVYPGGLASSGENAQSVRGRQRNSWFCFVSEPPLPHRRCGLVGGRCVRAAQLARVRRRVNWCRAGESTKESAREEGPLREA